MHNIDLSDNKIEILASETVKQTFKTIFSTAEISYQPTDTKTVTSMEVDEGFQTSKKSSANLASEIQQLFIDLQTNDANELNDWVRNNPKIAPPEKIVDKRIKRFRNAFKSIFGESFNYETIETSNGIKKVLFKKNNNFISIANLSSGEKQIVFRGAFLLQNQQKLFGCPMLIDEPEISLHPLWQSLIFEFYRQIGVASNYVQTSQMFIATHSQFVLKTALERKLNKNDTAIFVMRHDNQIIVEQKQLPFILPNLTIAELMYISFGVVSNDYHNELYGYLQRKIKTTSVVATDRFIFNSPQFDKSKHSKKTTYKTTIYFTLTSYIRNWIDHPGGNQPFTKEELKESIDLLIELCK